MKLNQFVLYHTRHSTTAKTGTIKEVVVNGETKEIVLRIQDEVQKDVMDEVPVENVYQGEEW